LATQKEFIISLIGDFLSKNRECMTKYSFLFIFKQNGGMCSLVFKHPTNLIFYPLVSKPLIVSRFFSEASCTIDKSITSTKDPKNQGNRTRDFVVPSSF
jgi:hypothetical protein